MAKNYKKSTFANNANKGDWEKIVEIREKAIIKFENGEKSYMDFHEVNTYLLYGMIKILMEPPKNKNTVDLHYRLGETILKDIKKDYPIILMDLMAWREKYDKVLKSLSKLTNATEKHREYQDKQINQLEKK